MSGVTKKLISASGGVAGGFTAIEDVFSTYLLPNGTSSTQTFVNGIDLANEGGMVWLKSRTIAIIPDHYIADSERVITQGLKSNSTAAEGTVGSSLIKAFNSDGFDAYTFDEPYVTWTFRKAPRFFDVVTYTGNGGAQTIAHNLGTTVGTIIVKSTSEGNWGVFHRSEGPSKYGILHDNLGFQTDQPNAWNGTAPTDTEFSVGATNATNASGGTFVAYLFAHDPLGPSGDGSDGLIDCGSYTGNGTSQEIDLGWEPQWVMVKSASTGGSFYDWYMFDNMRGMNHSTGNNELAANVSRAEGDVFGTDAQIMSPTPRGFLAQSSQIAANASGVEYIYIAIRRGPMRAPESGTEVFAVEGLVARTESPWFRSGFPVDFALRARPAFADEKNALSRLTGDKMLRTDSTNAETTNGQAQWDYMDGYADAVANSTFLSWMFRRAPEFFDVVAYTGDGTAGRTVPHNLGVAPEMMIVKGRNTQFNWAVYHKDVGASTALFLNDDGTGFSDSGYFNSTDPTSDVFFLGGGGVGVVTNNSGSNHIAYLFATLAGISKVGSYTGNGTSQTINCGFTTGARFIIIKRTDSTGDWYVWDTARGIIAGNDPFLELNTSDAEVTSDDSIDPDSSGFIVNQTAVTDVNVNAASYIFYAVA